MQQAADRSVLARVGSSDVTARMLFITDPKQRDDCFTVLQDFKEYHLKCDAWLGSACLSIKRSGILKQRVWEHGVTRVMGTVPLRRWAERVARMAKFGRFCETYKLVTWFLNNARRCINC
jgi:hypothetical protein